MKIDFERIERETGRKFESAEELICFVQRQLYNLSHDNKIISHVNIQKILELNDIAQAITE